MTEKPRYAVRVDGGRSYGGSRNDTGWLRRCTMYMPVGQFVGPEWQAATWAKPETAAAYADKWIRGYTYAVVEAPEGARK